MRDLKAKLHESKLVSKERKKEMKKRKTDKSEPKDSANQLFFNQKNDSLQSPHTHMPHMCFNFIRKKGLESIGEKERMRMKEREKKKDKWERVCV